MLDEPVDDGGMLDPGGDEERRDRALVFGVSLAVEAVRFVPFFLPILTKKHTPQPVEISNRKSIQHTVYNSHCF